MAKKCEEQFTKKFHLDVNSSTLYLKGLNYLRRLNRSLYLFMPVVLITKLLAVVK